MIELGAVAAAYCILATLVHIVTTALAVRRCAAQAAGVVAPQGAPPVTIVRPVCGIDAFEPLTLESTFLLAYERYEIIFCVAHRDDPAISLVEALIARHHDIPARLLVGEDLGSDNPKLNNMAKGWAAARYDWIVFADSNVLMPADYVQRLLQTWRLDTGLVCSPPIGSHPSGFWAEVECAFLNGYQARWQYAADTIGYGFAQGKTMLWRRADLAVAGGMRALAGEIAEDAAATKIVRAAGMRVRLVDRPFAQPLGSRTFASVWARQLRWAQLRRQSFPAQFLPEILTGSLLPLISGAASAQLLDLPWHVVVPALAATWFGCEFWLVRRARWHLSWRLPVVSLCRDLMLPALWIAAWLARSYAWRGNLVRIAKPGATETRQAATAQPHGYSAPAAPHFSYTGHPGDL